MSESNREQPEAPDDEAVRKKPDEAEVIYYEGSPHVRGDLGSLLAWGAITLVLVVLGIIGFVFVWPFILSILLIIIGLLILSIPVLVMKTTHYRISNYRIDFERGILSKKIDTLELWHVDDINFRQSLLDRLLGVGTITVFSGDETTPNLPLHGIPRPRPVFDALKQRIIAVKRQRGVIKMDIG